MARVLVAGGAAVSLLAGCGGNDADPAADSSGPASSSAAETSAPDLASGLLTAEAFGPDARVVAVSPEQLSAGAGLGALGKDLTVKPAECAPAVQGTQPDLDVFDDIAGVTATSPAGASVEILLRGGPTSDAVDVLAAAVESCPQAQISSPEIGTATVTFDRLPVPDLGDGAIGLRFTTSVALPDGSQVTVPALLGLFEDGDRLGVLTTLGDPTDPNPPAPDPAAFTTLLQDAYEAQADALG